MYYYYDCYSNTFLVKLRRSSFNLNKCTAKAFEACFKVQTLEFGMLPKARASNVKHVLSVGYDKIVSIILSSTHQIIFVLNEYIVTHSLSNLGGRQLNDCRSGAPTLERKSQAVLQTCR